MDLFHPTALYKNYENATIVFFVVVFLPLLSSSLLLFFSFPFLCYCDLGAYRAKETCISTQKTANFIRLVFKQQPRYMRATCQTSFIVPQPLSAREAEVDLYFDILNLFPFLTQIMLIKTSQHKNNMIYIIKHEGLCQKRANSYVSSLVCTRNCEMDYFSLFHTSVQ